LNTASQNFTLLKNEHIVLCLRMMARLLKNTNDQSTDGLAKDERYTKLTQKAQESTENFNEYGKKLAFVAKFHSK
jgi:hypothetical protein